ncbi:hypothetical protein GC173_01770 [bacterium]|nr:hypothetical protein [bacterium]
MMVLNPRYIILALWLSLVMAFHGQGFADAVVSTRIASGDPAVAGSTFTVAVDVDSDAELPHAVALRLSYPTDSVEFLGVNDGVLGTASASNAMGVAPNVFRNIATIGDSSHGTSTTLAFTVDFRTLVNAAENFDITVDADSNTPANVIGADPFPTLTATYDSSATTGLAPVIPSAIISTSLASSPSVGGDQFDVAVAVSSNPFTLVPTSFSARLTYDAALVSYVGFTDGDLGPVSVGNEMGTSPNNYRDIASLGNIPNANLLAALGTFTFKVNDCITGPASIAIGVEADPSATATLIEVDVPNSTVSEIRSAFDSTATAAIAADKAADAIAFSVPSIATSGTERESVASVSVSLNNLVACPVDVTLVSDQSWLSVVPNSTTVAASGSVLVNLNVDPGTLPAGSYSANVTATSADGSGSAVLVVDLTLNSLPSVLVATSVTNAPATAGDIFTVGLTVADNPTTGLTPTAAVVRLNFDSAVVDVLPGSLTSGDLGPASISPVQGSSPNNWVTIGTLGDVNNANELPAIASVSFQVKECLTGTTSISIIAGEDNSAASPLLDVIVAPPAQNKILATFDSAATAALSAEPDAADFAFASASADFAGIEREFAATNASATLNNLTNCDTDVTFTSSDSWLTVNTTSGVLAGAGSLSVDYTVDPGNLPAGVYSATITAVDAANTASAVFTVNLTLSSLPVVEVATSLDVTPASAGDQFNVTVAVSDNQTTITPTAAIVRLTFDASVVTPVVGSAVSGDLGPVSVSNVSGTSPNNWVTIGTLGDVNNASTTPVIATVTFEVAECLTATSTLNIVAGEDPSAPSPLVDIVVAPPATNKILATFDSNATSGISVDPDAISIAFVPAGPIDLTVNQGSTTADETVQLSNTANCPTSVTLTSDAAWLSAAPVSATVAPGVDVDVTLSFDTASLAPGSYTGTVTATGTLGAVSSITVNLTVIENAVIALSTNSIIQTLDAGTSTTATFVVSNIGGRALNFTASDDADWISLSPEVGSLAPATSDTITVVLDASSLLARIAPYTATITVADAAANNSPQTISVALTVVGQPTIAVAPPSITRTINEGTNAAPTSLTLSNTGTDVLNYTATSTAAWVSVAPNGGSVAAGGFTNLNVTFNTAALPPTAPGTPLTASIIVADPNATNGQVVVPVTLTINNVIDPAVIASTVISGNPCVPGSTFTVRYQVATNGETGLIARNFTFAVEYNTNAIEFVSAVKGQLGNLDVVNNPPVATPPNNATHVLTSNFFFGNPTNATPVLADVTFRVKETGFLAPYSITMASFNGNFPLTGGLPNTSIGSTRIDSIFDASATSGLGLCPILEVNPLDFAQTIDIGNDAASEQSIVENLGNVDLNYTATSNVAWITPTPASATLAAGTSTTLTLNFNTAGLPGGEYVGVVTIADAAAVNSPLEITVSITIIDPNPPVLGLDRTDIAVAIDERTNAADETVVFSNDGIGGALTYSLSSSAPWLSAGPAAGIIDAGTTSTVTLSFNTAALAPGSYSGTITATGNFTNSPQTISVDLTVNDVVTAPADTIAFGFDANNEGWSFFSPALNLTGIGISDIGTSNEGAIAGSIDLVTSTTKTFAYWSSPRFDIVTDTDNVTPGAVAIGGTSGSDSLFRLAVNVSTDVTSKALVPTFRLRTSAWDWQQADVLVVTSTDIAGNSGIEYLPDAAGRDYIQYFTQPAGSSSFRVDLDVTNFDPLDQAASVLKINGVEVAASSQTDLASSGNETEVVNLDLTSSSAGFTSGTLPLLFGEPIFTADANGLGITGVGNVTKGANPDDRFPNPLPVVDYGAWELNAFDATFTAGTTYRIDFTVGTNATNVMDVPTFRLRTNAASQVFASYVNINSSNGASNIPTAGNPVTYSMFLEAPAEIDGDFWIFAFEYIYSSDTDDSRDAAIFLENLRVRAY